MDTSEEIASLEELDFLPSVAGASYGAESGGVGVAGGVGAGGSGGGGGGGAGGAAQLIVAITKAVEAAVNIASQAVDKEYSPAVRMKHAQEFLPRLYSGIEKIYRGIDKAKAEGWANWRDTVNWLYRERGVTGIVGGPQADDTLNMQLWIDAINNHGDWFHNDGFGNVVNSQMLAQSLLSEVLFYASLPAFFAMIGGLSEARASAIAALNSIFNKPDGLTTFYGKNNPDAKAGRLPYQDRVTNLNTQIEWYGWGLLKPNQPLPTWMLGFRVDGADSPSPAPTVGAYTTLTQAIGAGVLTRDILDRLLHPPEVPDYVARRASSNKKKKLAGAADPNISGINLVGPVDKSRWSAEFRRRYDAMMAARQ